MKRGSLHHFVALLPTLTGLLGLAGCVSLADFEAMTPHQRAMVVCQREPALVAYQSDIQRLEGEVRQARQALERGHRKEKRCVRYPVASGSKTTCKTIEDEQGERTECTEKVQYKNKRRCEDVFLPIDASVERQNIQTWQAQIARLQQARTSGFQACYQSVLPLDAKAAFLRY